MDSEPPDSGHPYQDIPNLVSDTLRLARAALLEDGPTDVTSELIAGSGRRTGTISSRVQSVAACLLYAEELARQTGCEVEWMIRDGDVVSPGGVIGAIHGNSADIARAERPMLNLLQRAGGIATATRRLVDAVSGTRCRILHTRKTAPGLRLFDVSAVVAGGGQVHRLGLDRVVMIKDNHWAELESQGADLPSAVVEARRRGLGAVHIEVESAAQVKMACDTGADRLLVDNRTPEEFRALADLAGRLAPNIEIEATGGITLRNVRAYAEAGADFVSVGALTHSVQAVDLTLEV